MPQLLELPTPVHSPTLDTVQMVEDAIVLGVDYFNARASRTVPAMTPRPMPK